jgi:hypothetical protein
MIADRFSSAREFPSPLSYSLLLRLLNSRCRLNLGEYLCGLADALLDEKQGNNNPEEVAEEVVGPEVESLRSAVDNIVDDLLERADGVVQDVTIQLAQADDELEGMAQRMVDNDEVDAEEGHWAPEDSSDGFHADGEGVLGHVARIREGVFLPELAEDVCLAGHVECIIGKVTCVYLLEF